MKLVSRKHWMLTAAAWLGVCVALLALASCSAQKPLNEPPNHFRATITLAPGYDESAFYALIGSASPYRSTSVYPVLMTGQPHIFTLDFRSEQQIRLLTKQLQERALPVLAIYVEKLGL